MRRTLRQKLYRSRFEKRSSLRIDVRDLTHHNVIKLKIRKLEEFHETGRAAAH
jgi:hypothetical protein